MWWPWESPRRSSVGLSLGASQSGATDSKSTNASTAGATSNTYSPWQTTLQALLGGTLSNQITGATTGTESPDVKALQAQSDNQINANYSSLGTNLNKSLASRGFGDSGTTGSAALQTELGRQGAIANNQGNFAGLQLNQNQGFLSDALAAAFNSMGQTNNQNSNSNSNENSTGWGFKEGAGFSVPGFGG